MKHHIGRRHFIGTAATVVAKDILLPTCDVFDFLRLIRPDEYSETPHFWYHNPLNKPYFASQNKDIAFAFTDSEIMLSDNNSHTWSHKKAFTDAKNITFSHIFSNGTVLFATREKLYRCTKKIKSYPEIIAIDTDGKVYLPRKSKNPDNPVICRHIHSAEYNPAEDAFYACMDDGNKPVGWEWKIIITESLNTRYKAGSISFVVGQMYRISDVNGSKSWDRRIFLLSSN